MSPGIAVAVIPEEYYRKPKGVQFRNSFRNRADAVNYAEQHSCRVVIACKPEQRYDVLCDPVPIRGPNAQFELVADRGELVAMPTPAPPQGELPEPHRASAAQDSHPCRKRTWSFVHNWLGV